jgi:hypothetical protein
MFCGHQNQRPSIVAMVGSMNERTTRVSKRSPRPIVVPIWPMIRRSLMANDIMVKANTKPAEVTTLPVPASERMMPVLMPPPRSSMNRDTRRRL